MLQSMALQTDGPDWVTERPQQKKQETKEFVQKDFIHIKTSREVPVFMSLNMWNIVITVVIVLC